MLIVNVHAFIHVGILKFYDTMYCTVLRNYYTFEL